MVANGGVSVVTAILVEPAGTFVPDGTEVFFFTNLGRVDACGKTMNGVARVNFVADARSGKATVTAISGGPAPRLRRRRGDPERRHRERRRRHGRCGRGRRQRRRGQNSATVEISIGSTLPTRVQVAANPQRITSPRQSTITATVFDQFGNPVQNVPVAFSLSGSLIEETLASGGAPIVHRLQRAGAGHPGHEGAGRRRAEDGDGDGHHRQRHRGLGDGVRRLRTMRRAILLGLLLTVPGTGARAEIALLSSGLTLKLDGHRVEDGLVLLALKGGGEMGVPPAAVRGFVPDEVLDEVAAPAGGDLRELAAAAARRHGLDPDLVMAVVSVESGFRPQAVSPKGAQGLMQLMPKTASSLGVADAFDPAQNLDGGARYLGQLLTLYGGDLTRALAAYNAGEGAVDRHRGVPPYRETRAYVKKVLERYGSQKKP